jgi:hypothetical protein
MYTLPADRQKQDFSRTQRHCVLIAKCNASARLQVAFSPSQKVGTVLGRCTKQLELLLMVAWHTRSAALKAKK